MCTIFEIRAAAGGFSIILKGEWRQAAGRNHRNIIYTLIFGEHNLISLIIGKKSLYRHSSGLQNAKENENRSIFTEMLLTCMSEHLKKYSSQISNIINISVVQNLMLLKIGIKKIVPHRNHILKHPISRENM